MGASRACRLHCKGQERKGTERINASCARFAMRDGRKVGSLAGRIESEARGSGLHRGVCEPRSERQDGKTCQGGEPNCGSRGCAFRK